MTLIDRAVDRPFGARTDTIALVACDLRNPFFTDIATAAEERASLARIAVQVVDTRGVDGQEEAALDRLAAQGIRGVLLAPRHGSGPHIDRARERGMHVVLVGTHSTQQPVQSVAVDGVRGGHLAVEHLLDQGHRSILFVGGPLDVAQVRDRLAGGRAAAAAVPGAKVRLLPVAHLTVADGIAAGEDILTLRRRPDAVFAANDLLALGLLQRLTAAGLRVPDDIAIVGYDDLDAVASASVAITSVRQPRRELARIATELLLDELEGRPATGTVLLEPRLVVRASSR